MFRLGVVVNPLAGIGGPLALKGSDGVIVQNLASDQGLSYRANKRTTEALMELAGYPLSIYCFSGAMGEDSVREAGFDPVIVGSASDPGCSTAVDTVSAAKCLRDMGVDLLLFTGGDGTARDIYRAIGDDFPVLGIPAGVKMHSGVYAVSPQAGGELIKQLMDNQLVDVARAEVRDIDEQAFREGQVRSRFYGELLVPREGRFLQQTKISGKEVEELVLADIAADIVESMLDDCLYLVGPGTTPRSFMDALGLQNTLLGIDAVKNGQLVGLDLNEQDILKLIAQHAAPVKIILTPIGGQGHILGRGNQQLSPAVIRAVGFDNILIIATKTKITSLQGRPLLLDTNDTVLDKELAGYKTVITGYHDSILYPVGLNTPIREQAL
jgi:predicted polyphosphate/ATP-dependent NAD kinase